MRISDWSSDVCSSDLEVLDVAAAPGLQVQQARTDGRRRAGALRRAPLRRLGDQQAIAVAHQHAAAHRRHLDGRGQRLQHDALVGLQAAELREAVGRSEEHTSELQSLMRISYAVFCLKNKKEVQHKYPVLVYMQI